MKRESTQQSVIKLLVVTSIVAAMLLVITNSAIWVNRQIFNSTNFTNTAVTAITSESSRQAIGARITDELLAGRPVIKNVAGDQINNLVSGLLGTDQAEKLLTAAVSRLQVYVTSSDQQDVDIDLTGIKTTVARIASIVNPDQESRIDPNKIPDKLVVIEADNVPDLYSYGVAISWLAPLSALTALGLFVWPYFRDKKNYKLILAVQGAAIAVAGFLSLLIGPLFRPLALGPFSNVNGRTVVGNLYDAFIQTFNTQSSVLVYVGLLLAAVAGVLWAYPAVRTMLKKEATKK